MKIVVLENMEEEALFEKFIKNNKTDRRDNLIIPEIRMFLTDCDGCLTDGGMYYSELGDELKKFNTRDGMGFALLHQMGILTGIVTSEDVELNRRRSIKLKLDIMESGCKNKLEKVKKLCEIYNVALNNVCYIGDDINDISTIASVGLGCCPSDAVEEVKSQANYIAYAKGGEGVIREVVDLIRRGYA